MRSDCSEQTPVLYKQVSPADILADNAGLVCLNHNNQNGSKIMKKFNFYLMLFVGTVLVFSCQKPIETNLDSETSVMSDDMKVIDGILQLPNQKTFDDLTQDLAKQQDKLSDFESKFSGFVSMRTAFAALEDIDAENIVKNGITERTKDL